MEKILRYMMLSILFSAQGISQQAPVEFPEFDNLSLGNVSPRGKWILFTVGNSKGDTLYLKNMVVEVTRKYPGGKDGVFSPDEKWFAYADTDSLYLEQLVTGKRFSWPGFAKPVFRGAGRYLTAYGPAQKTLVAVDLKTVKATRMHYVVEVAPDASGDCLALVVTNGGANLVKTVTFGGSMKVKLIASGLPVVYTGLAWNRPSTALAFFEPLAADGQRRPHRIRLVHLQGIKAADRVLEAGVGDGIFSDYYIPKSKLLLSDDGKTVFFDLAPLAMPASAPEGVSKLRVFRSDDLSVPPSTRDMAWFASQPKWAAWDAATAKVRLLDERPERHLTVMPGGKRTLEVADNEYKPVFKYKGDFSDLYSTDLVTGEKDKIAEMLSLDRAHISMSPNGNYVAYFKEGHWWLYSFAGKTTLCITRGTPVPWDGRDLDPFYRGGPYAAALWADDESRLLLCDRFDLYSYDPGRFDLLRLTRGREKDEKWRPHPYVRSGQVRDSYASFLSDKVSLDTGLLLIVTNNATYDQGLGHYGRKKGFRDLVRRHGKITWAVKAPAADLVQFMETRADLPPLLVTVLGAGEVREEFQSSPFFRKFNWSGARLVDYKAKDGRTLKAALLYPANYDKARKYPMVVNIYEDNSPFLHEFRSPSGQADDGLNFVAFTQSGYFYLLPEIAYEAAAPGASALYSVDKAIDAALAVASIDPDRLGLTGHSFGGYESALIATMTNRFRTIVIGAPVTDPVAHYLTLDGFGESNVRRYDYQQFRMGKPYYGEEFRKNSPLLHVEKIGTPILLWAGKKDGNVPWSESLKLYTAMWRLGKKGVFLLYDDVDHCIDARKDYEDVSRRIMHWFDIYLKGTPPEDWAK